LFRLSWAEVAVVIGPDFGTYNVNLMTGVDFFPRSFPDSIRPARVLRKPHYMSGNGCPPSGEFIEDGGLKIAEHGHRHCAGNRRSSHNQQMRRTLGLGTQGV